MGAFIRSDSPEAALEWGGVSCVRFFLLNFTVLLYNFFFNWPFSMLVR